MLAGPSRAAFSFNGTSLSVYTAVEMDTDVTVATCQMDSKTAVGAKRVRPIDNVVQLFQPVCQFTNLDPSTEHKVVVEYVAGGRLNLDYITYTPTERSSASGPPSLFVDDGDPGVVYTTPSGQKWVEDLLQGAVGGTRHSSAEVGAKATFQFNGTNVRVYASHPHDQGLSTSRYYIDDGSPGTSYSSPTNFSWHQVVFDSGELEVSQHTLTIEVEKGPVPLDYILYRSNHILLAGSSINEQVYPTTPSDLDTSDEVLSNGAIAGIAVAAAVAIAAMLALMICFIRRRRRNATYPSAEESVVYPVILNQARATRQPSGRSVLTKGQLGLATTAGYTTTSPLTTHPPHHAWAEPLPAYSEVFPMQQVHGSPFRDTSPEPPRRQGGLLTVRNGGDTVLSPSTEGGHEMRTQIVGSSGYVETSGRVG